MLSDLVKNIPHKKYIDDKEMANWIISKANASIDKKKIQTSNNSL